ncbi:unnamed protein product [Ascophyllum nodosum]
MVRHRRGYGGGQGRFFQCRPLVPLVVYSGYVLLKPSRHLSWKGSSRITLLLTLPSKVTSRAFSCRRPASRWAFVISADDRKTCMSLAIQRARTHTHTHGDSHQTTANSE